MDPSPEEIRLQLDRLLTSGIFTNADRMSGFLRYIVERALAGESEQVKEYVIGVAVFGRDEQYDPRLDSIVRVEARRLRTKLDEYYAGEGREDPVVISMRRGGYVPTFERRLAAPVASSAPPDIDPTAPRSWRRPGLTALALVLLFSLPLGFAAWRAGLGTTIGRATPIVTIGVLPFAEFSTDDADERLAAQLTDGVTSELARIRSLGVASHTSVQQFAGARRPLSEIAQTLDVELILEASVFREGDNVRVEARLVDVARNRKLWVEDFVGALPDLQGLERRVAVAAGRVAEQSRNR